MKRKVAHHHWKKHSISNGGATKFLSQFSHTLFSDEDRVAAMYSLSADNCELLVNHSCHAVAVKAFNFLIFLGVGLEIIQSDCSNSV